MSRGGRGAGTRKPPPPSARRAALRGLVAIERAKCSRLRDAVVMDGLTDRDRDFAWELAQGTERLHLMLDFVLSQFVAKRLPKVAVVRSVLRLGAYQLLVLSRVPARAAVHETVALLPDRRGFPNAVLRQLAGHIHPRAAEPFAARREWSLPAGPDGPRCLAFDEDVLPEADTHEFLAARFGLPEFLVRRWVQTHGFEPAARACRASSEAPSIFLRATHRAPDPTELTARLAAEDVLVDPFDPPMFRVTGGSPFRTTVFAQGWIIAQDPTAHAAARALDVQPGDKVLDVCAAPGTKTTVLAEAAGETGTVFAWDAKAARMKFVRDNAARLGLEARIRYPDGTTLDEPVDRALADVPCSNTGVLARRVEVRRRLTEDSIRELTSVQLGCLKQALAACRIGGTVVYSTCSIEPEENHGVVAACLGPDCELIGDRLTLPQPTGGDGGYFAVLRRK